MKTLAVKGYHTYTKYLGCVHACSSQFDIPLDRIVLDDLHLLLRLEDVLLRNLILQVDSMGHKKEHEEEESNGIRELEEAVRSCGELPESAKQRTNWQAHPW